MLSPAIRSLDDADWHVDRLYDFLGETDASSIAATWSRWLVDLNRPPNDASLYPGKAATALCPELLFSGGPLYLDGRQPDAAEVEWRLRIYRQPYHRQLGELINAARAPQGWARLLDAHSIVSICPLLFERPVRDMNIGTNGGQGCSAGLLEEIRALLEAQTAFSG